MVSAPTEAAVTTIAEAARINEIRKRRIEVLLAQFAPGGVSAASETRIGGVVKQCITKPRIDFRKAFLYLTVAVHFTARREWDSGD
jgi:hypothetical protein